MENLVNIGKGHALELIGANKNFAEERLKICRACPIYTNNRLLGEVCNSKLYLNPKTDEISFTPKEGYVKGCGCRLNAKTRLDYMHCIAGKW